MESNSKAQRVRNLCIMAHVDHGKTTLADTLIATNGIISEKQAGSIKYMDSRPDEMARGITMKSSCITLAYPFNNESYLINLIDSPGHVDFTSGVCAQTKAVMRQAWVSGVKPVLVLNKLDRLILEKELTPLDAYYHIANVLEQVNAYMAELYNTDMFGRTNDKADAGRRRLSSSNKTDSHGSPAKSSGTAKSSDVPAEGRSFGDWTIEDVDDSGLYFSPTDGNVVFASAVDCWGFGISQFADQFSSKLGMILSSYDNASFLLQVYKKVRPATADPADVRKIADSLSIKMPGRLLETTSESKTRFLHICSSWLPLSKAVLSMVVQQLPAPTALSEERAQKLLTTATLDFRSLPACSRALLPHMQNCSNAEAAPLIVYVSKMFGVSCKKLRDADEKQKGGRRAEAGRVLPRRPAPQPLQLSGAGSDDAPELDEKEEDEEELLAFARVFSGSIKPGQEVYVLGPKHSPSAVAAVMSPDGHLTEELLASYPHITKCKVGGVYLLLGREVQRLSSAGAGMVVGIAGLTGHIVKSGSLSSTVACPPFTHVISAGSSAVAGVSEGPLLRVQVLPKNPRCLPKLREGLRLLNQADPCVEIWLESSGEYMVGAAGEVHLQRCLSDLQEKYARTPVTASDPIVPFRETIVQRPLVDNTNEAIQGENVDSSKQVGDGAVEVDAALGRIRVRAVPLPSAVTDLLFQNSDLLSTLSAQSRTINTAGAAVAQSGFLSKHSDAFNSQINSPKLLQSLLTTDLEKGSLDVTQNEAPKSDVESFSKGIQESGSHETGNSVCDSSWNENSSNGISVCASALNTNNNYPTKLNEGDNTIDLNISVVPMDNSSQTLEVNEASIDINTYPASNCNESTGTTDTFPVGPSPSNQGLTRETQASLVHLKKKLAEAFAAAGEEWVGAEDQMWVVGPHYCGPNVLLNRIEGYKNRPSIWMHKASMPASPLSSMDHALVTGFQLCCAGGSLCEEPLMGTCFVVEEWMPPETAGAALPPGKVMAISKELFLSAFDEQPRRMMVATYSCVVSVNTDVVGRVYSVLGRRHGRILHGDITEGSSAWNVTAYLPIVESIDFANELRKATSGEAQPQLVFSHWETLDVDPYWDPCTSEELKHFGEKADTENLARQYMNAVRKRKGIKEYGKKLVEFGEKQRTLTKNK
ncbi:Transcription factor GTP-binding domain [Trinorchestia longiramus]|nr:Transcription factor GTP-binding domain [Trinorchestia longiramus]